MTPVHFPPAENSRFCQSFHSPFGAYRQNRDFYGITNAVRYFKSSEASIFGQLELLIYFGYILGYAWSKTELIENLHDDFDTCRAKNLKMNPNKCD